MGRVLEIGANHGASILSIRRNLENDGKFCLSNCSEGKNLLPSSSPSVFGEGISSKMLKPTKQTLCDPKSNYAKKIVQPPLCDYFAPLLPPLIIMILRVDRILGEPRLAVTFQIPPLQHITL